MIGRRQPSFVPWGVKPLGCSEAGLLCEFNKILEWHWFSKIEALTEFNISCLEELKLFFFFNTFGDDLKVECSCKSDDGCNDFFLLSINADAVDESFVDFERVEWKTCQGCK